jgi:hypothetical protein
MTAKSRLESIKRGKLFLKNGVLKNDGTEEKNLKKKSVDKEKPP